MTKPATDELISEIEAGLEGVTPGPWTDETPLDFQITIVEANRPTYEWEFIASCAYPERGDRIKRNHTIKNARHIARCSPDNIAALIARIREQDAEIERMREKLVAIGGPCSGMPDTSCEALRDARRIADHDKQLWLTAEARATAAEAKLAEAMKVIERLCVAVSRLLSCPAITEGDIHDPEWGCEESAEAESFASAALKGGEAWVFSMTPCMLCILGGSSKGGEA